MSGASTGRPKKKIVKEGNREERPKKKVLKTRDGERIKGSERPNRPVKEQDVAGKKRPPVKEYAREVPRKSGKGQPKGKRPAAAVQKKKGNKVLSLIWDITFYGFLAVILLGVLLFNFNDNPNKQLFGFRFMTVLTDSMAPGKEETKYKNGFPSGSLVFISKTNPQSLKVGDIITFNPVRGDNSSYLTHRIKKVHTEMSGEKGLFFTTRGDANTGDDIPITAKQVVGKVVFHVSYVGNIVRFLRENIVIVAIFAASIFAFIIVLKYYLGMEENAPPAPRKKRAIKQ